MASRTLQVKIVGDASSLERALGRANRQAATFGSRIDGQAKAMTRFHSSIGALAGSMVGAAGLIDVLKKSVGAASDLHEQLNKTDVVFKSSAKSVKSWSKDTATGMGIARHEALAMASTFGNMLVPMGFARDRAAQMSTRLVKLSADMASFNNASPEETLAALQSGLAGQVRPLRQFGVFLSQDRIKAEALSDGIIKATGSVKGIAAANESVAIAQARYTAALKDYGAGTTQAAAAHVALLHAQEALDKAMQGHVGTLTAAQKAAATYAIILKDTKDAQGDFARTSGGLANQQRILKAQLQDTMAEIGTALMPTVLAVTKRFNAWLKAVNESGDAQKYVKEAVHDAKVVIAGVTPIVKGAEKAFELLKGATGGSKHAVELLTLAFIAFKLRGVGSLVTGVGIAVKALTGLKVAEQQAATAGLGLPGMLGTAGLIGAGIGLAGVGITDAMTHTAQKTITGLGLKPTGTAGIYRNPNLAGSKYEYVTVSASGKTTAVPAGGFATGVISGADRSNHGGGGITWSGKSLGGEQAGFVSAFEQAVAAIGGTSVRVISGKRTPGTNPGVKNSNHLTGNAIDAEIFIPGKGWVPAGTALKGVAGKFGLRSGDQAGFYLGKPDPNHVDNAANQGGGGGGGGLTVGKPSTVHTPAGTKLLPTGLQIALSKAMGTGGLADDAHALQKAIAYLKGQKQTTEVAHELGILEKQLRGVHKAVANNLKKAQAALRAKQQPLRDTAAGIVSSAFQSYSSKVTGIFDAQTAAQLSVLGGQFFQGGRSPLEKKLADMQAADTLQGLQDALTNAQTPEEQAAAQRQLDEYNLAADAAKERAQADADYADAVKKYTNERALQEEKLNDALAKFGTQLAAGKVKLSDLNDVVAPFGINLNDVGDAADSLAYSMGGLQTAVRDLAGVIAMITGKPVNLGAGPYTVPGGGMPGRNALVGLAIPMADGGAGRTFGPTLFYSDGNEDFAFSGEGRSFGGGGSGGDLVIKIGEQEFIRLSKRLLTRDSKRNGGTGIRA